MSSPGKDLKSLFDVSQAPDNHIAATVHAALYLLQALAASRRDAVAG